MEVRQLGRSGVAASRIGLGCTTFGREIDEDEAFRIMDHAVERDIRLFDTAEAYGGGQAREYRKSYLGIDDVREVSGETHSSEKIIGRWLQSRGTRQQITLLTKVTSDFSPAHVRQALAGSLERLQTDFVDLYLYHQFDAKTPVDEAMAAADECVREGLARAMGCSNYTGVQLAAALEASRSRGGTWDRPSSLSSRFEVIESNYNLAVRAIEQDVLPLAQKESIGVITYSPLGAGFLTGKYTPDRSAFPKGTRFDVIPGHADVYFSERNFRIVEKLHELSRRTGVSAVHLAIGWVLQNTQVDVMLVGARTISHVDNAIAASEMQFEPEWLDVMRGW
jgi:aryl-alcohol dehydrogenase-like predicted oxidoreductase